MLRFVLLLCLIGPILAAAGCDSAGADEGLYFTATYEGAPWEGAPHAFTFVDGYENLRLSAFGTVGDSVAACPPTARCEEFRLLLPLIGRREGTYELDLLGWGGPVAMYSVVDEGTSTLYLTPPEGGGTVVITTFDEGDGVVAGTFDAPLVNTDDPSDRIEFVQGRFRSRLEAR